MHSSVSNVRSAQPIHLLLLDDREKGAREVHQLLLDGRVTNQLWVVPTEDEVLALLRSSGMPAERWLLLIPIDPPSPRCLELLAELRVDPRLRAVRTIALRPPDSDLCSATAVVYFDGALRKPLQFLSFMELMADLGRGWQFVENLPEIEVVSSPMTRAPPRGSSRATPTGGIPGERRKKETA